MFSTAHELLNMKLKPNMILWWYYTKVMTFTLWHFVEIISCSIKKLIIVSVMPLLYLFKFVIPLFPHRVLLSSRSLPFNPLQVCARPHTNTRWIRRTFQIFELGSIWCPNIHWIVSLLCYDFDYPYLFWWFVYLFISMLCKI